jgi:hypothetical protein
MAVLKNTKEIAELLGPSSYEAVYSKPYNAEKYLKQGYRLMEEVASNSGVLDHCVRQKLTLQFPN